MDIDYLWLTNTKTLIARIEELIAAPGSTTAGLTDAQLRAAAVPVSAAALPLPAGAATAAKQDTAQTTLDSSNSALNDIRTVTTTSNDSLTAINGKLPALDTGRVPVILPPGGGGLTDSELRATPVEVASTALVSESPQSLIDGDTAPLSLTYDGRLRVSTLPARLEAEYIPSTHQGMYNGIEDVPYGTSPWRKR